MPPNTCTDASVGCLRSEAFVARVIAHVGKPHLSFMGITWKPY